MVGAKIVACATVAPATEVCYTARHMGRIGTYLLSTVNNAKAFSSEVTSILGEVVPFVEREMGMSIVLVLVAVAVSGIVLALILDSTQGRGRRFRRGYRVGYTETLGRERAKMRVKLEEEGKKKPGWRER